MPSNTVSVTRPGRWGNPVKQTLSPRRDLQRLQRSDLVSEFRRWLRGEIKGLGTPPQVHEIRVSLGGKNLACFCPLDHPCHADVLLEIANAPICEAVPT